MLPPLRQAHHIPGAKSTEFVVVSHTTNSKIPYAGTAPYGIARNPPSPPNQTRLKRVMLSKDQVFFELGLLHWSSKKRDWLLHCHYQRIILLTAMCSPRP